ncbi:MAG: endonuclease/exonuclease/phosphatase family protein [Planctomycetota bacterium]
MTHCITPFALAISAAMAAAAPEPRTDGTFPEWTTLAPIATDPAADATGGFDVTFLYATNRDTRLFLHFDITNTLNLQSGSPLDGGFEVLIGLPNGSTLSIDLRNRRNRLDGTTTYSWRTLDLLAQPTFAAPQVELSLDLSALDIEAGDTITIDFAGSDSLAQPAAYTMQQRPDFTALRPHDRHPQTDIRIASLNTLRTGLFNPSQAPGLSRLIDAFDADIYCFQEEYNSSAAQIAALLLQIDPLEDGATWFVHKNNDNVIAAPRPVLPVPASDGSYAAAVVPGPTGGVDGAVIVFSIHPKCCGHIGSSEDSLRIAQMQLLIQTLGSFRSGALGETLVPYAAVPVVVIGDWNLVGSRVPLDLLEFGAPDMRQVDCPNLADDSIATWRGTNTSSGSFPPGRLDLVCISNTSFTALRAFCVETAKLPSSILAILGLEAGDSGRSDHLMLVTDLRLGPPECPGDLTTDFVVNLADFAVLARNFGGGGGLTLDDGDITGDGYVGLPDFTELSGNFGADCR